MIPFFQINHYWVWWIIGHGTILFEAMHHPLLFNRYICALIIFTNLCVYILFYFGIFFLSMDLDTLFFYSGDKSDIRDTRIEICPTVGFSERNLQKLETK